MRTFQTLLKIDFFKSFLERSFHLHLVKRTNISLPRTNEMKSGRKL